MADRLRSLDGARVRRRARPGRNRFALACSAALACGAALMACSRGGEPPAAPSAKPVVVRAQGSFEAATRTGQTGASVQLLPLKADRSLVGLGVLSSLRGEVTLFGGQAFLSVPSADGAFHTEELGSHQDAAAFMVVASVNDWQTVALPENTALDDLPAALENLAKGAGLDAEQPLPFMIEGSVGNLTLSVINGSAFVGDREIPEEALKAASRRVTRATCQGTGVGFFAKGEHPEFLASDTHVHLHFVEQGGALAGHVDQVELPSGTSFRLPVAR